MKKVSLFLSISFAVIFFTMGLSLGYYLTPEYKTTMYSKGMDLGFPDRTFDLRYINAMISHHRGAMLLAEQLNKNTQREDLKKLSEEILKNEPIAIEELYKWKKDWYGDSRIVRDPVVSNLGSYDEKFDLRFLNAIISHHNDGIVMTKETLAKSSRTEIINNASSVQDFLQNGVITLKSLRLSYYGI